MQPYPSAMTGRPKKSLRLFALPFNDLLFQAHSIHRAAFRSQRGADQHAAFDQNRRLPGRLRLLPAECPFFDRRQGEKLMEKEAVLAEARKAKEAGASRFCMGAAWRSPKDRDIEKVGDIIAGVKALGLETCATLGMLNREPGGALKASGLDYYNHNLDTSEEYYERNHHHPHLSGSPRHARTCARCGHECVLRRHRRHGRKRE